VKAPRRKTSRSVAAPGVTVVTLGVRDLSRSRAFYCEGLGYEASSASNENIVFLRGGGIVLSLFGRDALAHDANLAPAGSGFAGVALARNVKSRAAVDAALEVVKKAGGTILKPAREAFWGGYSGYFADPDGHLWEIAHNPHWKLDSSGLVVLPR
jgi:catechol 2,3-dioxygenase-like lactoylglutathione lyase family enzyme